MVNDHLEIVCEDFHVEAATLLGKTTKTLVKWMQHAKETSNRRPHSELFPNMVFPLGSSVYWIYILRERNAHHVLQARYFGNGLCTKAPEGEAFYQRSH